MASEARTTPIRRQYLQLKQQHPDSILFFRLGDFYETFDDDAAVAAQVLGITLTGREMGAGVRVPMAGIPYHAADEYLARLVAAGYSVAIAEQVGTVTGRELVAREVVRVATPGTFAEPEYLRPSQNCYLCAVLDDGAGVGFAYADLSTGEFATTQFARASGERELAQELLRLQPQEILVPGERTSSDAPRPAWLPDMATLSRLEPRHWRLEAARDALKEHYEVNSLDGFGCEGRPLAVRAAGALLAYATTTQPTLARLRPLVSYQPGDWMPLDAQTVRNLELLQSSRGDPRHSVLAVLDSTVTPMGARLLRRWLTAPLTLLVPVLARQAAVTCLVEASLLRAEVEQRLRGVPDIERLARRAQQGLIQPAELQALGAAAACCTALRGHLLGALQEMGAQPEAASASPDAAPAPPNALHTVAARLRDLSSVASLIEQGLVAQPPARLGHGAVIRPGFAAELDGLREGIRDSKEWLSTLERRERERTQLRGLKVGFNKVFGYYIEVGRSTSQHVPADYIRKQTLVNAERFITPDLKEHEARILTAEEQIQELETAIFRQVARQAGAALPDLLATADAVAELDALVSLASCASRRGYSRPIIDDTVVLEVQGARHPVVEAALEGASFVPNDIHLDADARQIVVLTGPNMSGKSTYLRTVGLIVLLAQIGSFVPAIYARVGIADRIFTRVGASDDIASGQSTFMVEMAETAAILHHATRRSIVILDEIGRGTSTYDGMAIARAVVEYLHHTPRLGCRTLFATHYHELTGLADVLPRTVNAKMDVLEEGDRVVFLHRIVDGGADRSYGLHVAQLAGVPRAVIRRAREILNDLEAGATHMGPARNGQSAGMHVEPLLQLSFFAQPHPVLAQLRALDLDALSPFEALSKLYELRRLADEEQR